MKHKRKHSKLVIILCLILFVILWLAFCGSGHKIQTESDPDTKPALEWRTKSGQLCRVYTNKKLETDYLAAIEKTIKSFEPDADLTSFYREKEWTYSRFDDGMMEIPLPVMVINDYEYGGDIVLEFKDDSREDFSVHYLKIGPTIYVDDGIYDTDAYTEAAK